MLIFVQFIQLWPHTEASHAKRTVVTMVVLPLPQLLLFCTTPWGKLCCSTEEWAPLSPLSMLTVDSQLWLRSTAQADHLPTLSAPRNCSIKCYGSQSHINPRITNASSPGRLEPKPRAEPGTITEHNHLGLYCDLSGNSLGPCRPPPGSPLTLLLLPTPAYGLAGPLCSACPSGASERGAGRAPEAPHSPAPRG